MAKKKGGDANKLNKKYANVYKALSELAATLEDMEG